MVGTHHRRGGRTFQKHETGGLAEIANFEERKYPCTRQVVRVRTFVLATTGWQLQSNTFLLGDRGDKLFERSIIVDA